MGLVEGKNVEEERPVVRGRCQVEVEAGSVSLERIAAPGASNMRQHVRDRLATRREQDLVLILVACFFQDRNLLGCKGRS